MVSNLTNDLYIIENNDKIVIYSLNNQSWIRVGKDYIQTLNKEQLLSFLNRYHLLVSPKETKKISKRINSIYVFMTRKCNMKCSFCSMHAGPHIDISSELELNELVGFIKKIKAHEIGRIVISGGEPLLSEKMYPFIDFISNDMRETEIILQTNGTLITQEFCEKVKGKVHRINISIESIYDIWSPYREDFINRLDILYHNNIKMEFSFVVTKTNKEHIYNYIELCRKYNAEAGIKIVSAVGGEKRFEKMCLNEYEILEFYRNVIGYIIDNNYTNEENLQTILGYKPIPRKGCSAYSLQSFSILPEGDILRCHSIQNEKYNQLGTVTDGQIPINSKRKYGNDGDIFSVEKKYIAKHVYIDIFVQGFAAQKFIIALMILFINQVHVNGKKF